VVITGGSFDCSAIFDAARIAAGPKDQLKKHLLILEKI